MPVNEDELKNSERVWLRVNPRLKARLEERARADRRELAAWCRVQLELALERQDGEAAGPR